MRVDLLGMCDFDTDFEKRADKWEVRRGSNENGEKDR
jgi:hypothetical protein